jgi:hypothetical protein
VLLTRNALCGLFALALAACGPAMAAVEAPSPVPADAPREEHARYAGERWLAMLDRAAYGDTWQVAADMFRFQITAGQWEESMRQLRQQLGPVQERELIAARYETRIPNAPTGEYVILMYNSNFSRRPNMTETLTIQQEADGVWRMAGYFVTQN